MSKKNYLTLGAIVRNEAHYVREWLAHYRVVGFEKFVIVLHRCSDDTERQIRSLPFAADITIEHCGTSAPQVGCYNKLCNDYKSKTEWMAFLDADEFLFCPDGRNVCEFLDEFKKYGALIVHNFEFGSSGHVVRPSGPAISSFVHRAPNNYWMHDNFKSIVRLSEFERYVSPHLAHVKGGVVREDHRILSYDDIHYACGLKKGIPSISRFIRYNHYYVRSMEDFVARCYRGDASQSVVPDLNCKQFENRDHKAVLDFTIQRYEKSILTLLDGKLR